MDHYYLTADYRAIQFPQIIGAGLISPLGSA